MPKTRNVSRSQWEAAAPSTASTSTRSRKNKENAQADKENGPVSAGRAFQTLGPRHRAGVLGAVAQVNTRNPLGPKEGPTKLKTATKGKGKPTATPVKRKKVPLQDITSQFLPAPEPLNRGEGHQNLTEEDVAAAHDEPANIITTQIPAQLTPLRLPAPKFVSPLPPSSPPSPFVTSPVISSIKPTARFRHTPPPLQFKDPLEQFEHAFLPSRDSPTPARSNSDPFGFVALERKLKAEREKVLAEDPNGDDEEYDELAHVLVADTSSPRPVRRMKKRALTVDDEESEENTDASGQATEAVPVTVPAATHFKTPPTPHKDKQKRRRLSYEGHGDVFDPCSSSIESSPSPMKAASARKHAQSSSHDHPLGSDRAFDESLEEELPVVHSTRRLAAVRDETDGPSRHLRPRPSKSTVVEDEQPTRSSPIAAKVLRKTTKRSTTRRATDAEAHVEPVDDLNVKWQRERQERIEYFKRLEDFEVEREDVYLV